MIADRSHRSKARDRRSARAGCRDETHGAVVPVDDPCAFHGSPSETLDLELDRCPDRSRTRTHLEALCDFNTVLRDRLPINDHSHFMHSAVVFRNHKIRIELAIGIDIEFPERRRRLGIFLSFEVVVVLNKPSTRNRPPLQVDGLPRRQLCRHNVNLAPGNRRLLIRKLELLIRSI